MVWICPVLHYHKIHLCFFNSQDTYAEKDISKELWKTLRKGKKSQGT